MKKIITESEFAMMLRNFTGCSIVSVTTETAPKMLAKSRITKEPNPYLHHAVKRMCIRSGMIGAGYENAVNNQRDREAAENDCVAQEPFKAEALWHGAGKHESAALVSHRESGKLYMVFYPLKNSEDHARISQDTWLCDGREIDSSLLKDYLPLPSAAKQNVESPVMWRVIGLENVVSISMAGNEFTIIH